MQNMGPTRTLCKVMQEVVIQRKWSEITVNKKSLIEGVGGDIYIYTLNVLANRRLTYLKVIN